MAFVRGDAALCGPFARRRSLALRHYELGKKKVETEDGRLPTAFASCVVAPVFARPQPLQVETSRGRKPVLGTLLAFIQRTPGISWLA